MKPVEITDEAHKQAKKNAADAEIPMSRYLSDLVMADKPDGEKTVKFEWKEVPK